MKRPKCPRCDGKATIVETRRLHFNPAPDRTVPCPECMEDPGLASMDRIMAIANGVINDVDEYGTGTWQSVREYLIHGDLSKR